MQARDKGAGAHLCHLGQVRDVHGHLNQAFQISHPCFFQASLHVRQRRIGLPQHVWTRDQPGARDETAVLAEYGLTWSVTEPVTFAPPAMGACVGYWAETTTIEALGGTTIACE